MSLDSVKSNCVRCKMRRLHNHFFGKSSSDFAHLYFFNLFHWTCFSVWRWQWLRHYNNNCLPNATGLRAADFEDCRPIIVFQPCLASQSLGAFVNYSISLIQFQVPPCPQQGKRRHANDFAVPSQHICSWKKMNYRTCSNLFSFEFEVNLC